MFKIRARFWFVRFVQVFMLAFAVLAAVEIRQRGLQSASYDSALAWALLAAVFTASISAWWAYQRQCKVVFKD